MMDDMPKSGGVVLMARDRSGYETPWWFALNQEMGVEQVLRLAREQGTGERTGERIRLSGTGPFGEAIRVWVDGYETVLRWTPEQIAAVRQDEAAAYEADHREPWERGGE